MKLKKKIDLKILNRLRVIRAPHEVLYLMNILNQSPVLSVG